MRPWTRRVGGGVLVAGLLLGCSGDPEDAQLMQDPEADEEPELEDEDEGTPIGDEPASDTAPDSSSRGGEFLDVEAEVTQQHPSGVVIEIRGVRFEGTTILVDGELRNEGDVDAVFPVTTEPDRLRLLDDLGGMYEYVHPDDEGNEEDTAIELPAGESIEGPLGFIGPVDEEATSLRLVANVEDPDDFEADRREPDTPRPGFVLDEIGLETIS
jgi:hypothetical protein